MSEFVEKETRCCENESLYSVLYSVAGEKKRYLVCSKCIEMPCFSKFIIEKVPITAKNILKNKSHDSKSRRIN